MKRALLLCCLLVALPVRAQQQPTFIARANPTQVGVGETFEVEVTLSLDDGRVDGYKPPDFRGARVLSEQPSESRQIHMGGGGTFVQTVHGWHYVLQAQQKGTLSFGPA